MRRARPGLSPTASSAEGPTTGAGNSVSAAQGVVRHLSISASRSNSSAAEFTPVTAAARSWVMENVYTEPWRWVGGTFIVDHRFVQPLLSGILDAGMDMVA
jgi:hypothetical protein